MSLVLYAGAIVLLLLLRVPIAYSFLAPSIAYILLSDTLPHGSAIQQLSLGLESFVLLAVPMFILMGNLANWAGVAERLFTFILSLVGHLRGSLAYTNVIWNVIFSSMSGVAVADAATTAKVVVPVMERQGYPYRFAAGLTAASSLIGPTIPPSLPAVIYAVSAGVSLGAMLLAGIVPGLLVVAALFTYIWLWARNRSELVSPRATRSEILRATRGALPALLTPVILIVGILGGIVTPTEASVLAVTYLLLLGIPYRALRLPWRTSVGEVRQMFRDAAETTGTVLLIVAASGLCGFILALEGAPTLLAAFFRSLTTDMYVFLVILNIVLLLLGIFFEVSAMLVVLVALLLPVATSYGVDPIQLGVILIFNFILGSISPPVGLILSVISAALNRPLTEVNRGVIPFFVPLGLVLLAITFIPALSLWLPGMLGLGGR